MHLLCKRYLHLPSVGILAVLSIVTLSQQNAGGDAGAIAYMLAALKDRTFILGPGFMVGWGKGLILGYLMYASGLMPRRLAMFGLVGGPLIIITGVLVMFGVADQGGTLQGLATIPEFIWELGLSFYPLIWGFRRCPILDAYDSEFPVRGTSAVAHAY